MCSSIPNKSTFVKALVYVIPTREFLRIMGTLHQADHYLLSSLQTFIQPVMLQCTGSIESLPKKKYTRTAEQKEAGKLQKRGANERRRAKVVVAGGGA